MKTIRIINEYNFDDAYPANYPEKATCYIVYVPTRLLQRTEAWKWH